jgi:hypothetical protein
MMLTGMVPQFAFERYGRNSILTVRWRLENDAARARYRPCTGVGKPWGPLMRFDDAM